MPPVPKVCNRDSQVGTAEIIDQVEAHQPPHTYGYQRITSKVAINLKSIEYAG